MNIPVKYNWEFSNNIIGISVSTPDTTKCLMITSINVTCFDPQGPTSGTRVHGLKQVNFHVASLVTSCVENNTKSEHKLIHHKKNVNKRSVLGGSVFTGLPSKAC